MTLADDKEIKGVTCGFDENLLWGDNEVLSVEMKQYCKTSNNDVMMNDGFKIIIRYFGCSFR